MNPVRTRKKHTCEPTSPATRKKPKIAHACVVCLEEVEETEVFPCCQSRVCAPCLTRWNALATNRAAGCIVCRQTESAFVITWAAWHVCPAALRPHLMHVSEWTVPLAPGMRVLHKALRVRWDAPSLAGKTQQLMESEIWEAYTFVLSPAVTVRVLDAGPAAISDPNLWNLRIKNEDGEMAAAMPRFPLPPPPAQRRQLLRRPRGRVHLLAPVTAAGGAEAVRRVLRALREEPASAAAVQAETCRVHAMRDRQLWVMLTLRVRAGAGNGRAPPAWGPALDAALEEPAWRAGIPPALLPRNQKDEKENNACRHVLHYVAPPPKESEQRELGLTLNTYCPPGTAFSTFVDMAEREMNAVLPRVLRVMLGMTAGGRRGGATPTMQVTLGKRSTEPRRRNIVVSV